MKAPLSKMNEDVSVWSGTFASELDHHPWLQSVPGVALDPCPGPVSVALSIIRLGYFSEYTRPTSRRGPSRRGGREPGWGGEGRLEGVRDSFHSFQLFNFLSFKIKAFSIV